MGNFTSDALIRGNLHSDSTSRHFTARSHWLPHRLRIQRRQLVSKVAALLPAYQTLALPGARRGPEGVNATPKPLEHVIRPLDYRPLSLLSLLRQEENRSDQLQSLQGCTSSRCRCEKARRDGELPSIYLRLFHVPQVPPSLLEHDSTICLLHAPANLLRA